eukprot:TRINITY_DN2775_c0_g1_i2.p1 TRINITY_DN2775_c0_g1~~TRINITY_DN2775_c0_g1_i2.p1  ORF type:complete len:1870 (-),score=373.77 TRINITY_DN2775_c0_g1_i2:191-5800(-)
MTQRVALPHKTLSINSPHTHETPSSPTPGTLPTTGALGLFAAPSSLHPKAQLASPSAQAPFSHAHPPSATSTSTSTSTQNQNPSNQNPSNQNPSNQNPSNQNATAAISSARPHLPTFLVPLGQRPLYGKDMDRLDRDDSVGIANSAAHTQTKYVRDLVYGHAEIHSPLHTPVASLSMTAPSTASAQLSSMDIDSVHRVESRKHAREERPRSRIGSPLTIVSDIENTPSPSAKGSIRLREITTANSSDLSQTQSTMPDKAIERHSALSNARDIDTDMKPTPEQTKGHLKQDPNDGRNLQRSYKKHQVDLSSSPITQEGAPAFAKILLPPVARDEVHELQPPYLEDGRWVFSTLPARGPSGRKEVLLLRRWMDKELSKHKSAVREFQDEHRLIPSVNEFLESGEIHSVKQIFEACYHELIRQVGVSCAERGELMDAVWRFQDRWLHKVTVDNDNLREKITTLEFEITDYEAEQKRFEEEIKMLKKQLEVMTKLREGADDNRRKADQRGYRLSYDLKQSETTILQLQTRVAELEQLEGERLMAMRKLADFQEMEISLGKKEVEYDQLEKKLEDTIARHSSKQFKLEKEIIRLRELSDRLQSQLKELQQSSKEAEKLAHTASIGGFNLGEKLRLRRCMSLLDMHTLRGTYPGPFIHEPARTGHPSAIAFGGPSRPQTVASDITSQFGPSSARDSQGGDADSLPEADAAGESGLYKTSETQTELKVRAVVMTREQVLQTEVIRNSKDAEIQVWSIGPVRYEPRENISRKLQRFRRQLSLEDFRRQDRVAEMNEEIPYLSSYDSCENFANLLRLPKENPNQRFERLSKVKKTYNVVDEDVVKNEESLLESFAAVDMQPNVVFRHEVAVQTRPKMTKDGSIQTDPQRTLVILEPSLDTASLEVLGRQGEVRSVEHLTPLDLIDYTKVMLRPLPPPPPVSESNPGLAVNDSDDDEIPQEESEDQQASPQHRSVAHTGRHSSKGHVRPSSHLVDDPSLDRDERDERDEQRRSFSPGVHPRSDKSNSSSPFLGSAEPPSMHLDGDESNHKQAHHAKQAAQGRHGHSSTKSGKGSTVSSTTSKSSGNHPQPKNAKGHGQSQSKPAPQNTAMIQKQISHTMTEDRDHNDATAPSPTLEGHHLDISDDSSETLEVDEAPVKKEKRKVKRKPLAKTVGTNTDPVIISDISEHTKEMTSLKQHGSRKTGKLVLKAHDNGDDDNAGEFTAQSHEDGRIEPHRPQRAPTDSKKNKDSNRSSAAGDRKVKKVSGQAKSRSISKTGVSVQETSERSDSDDDPAMGSSAEPDLLDAAYVDGSSPHHDYSFSLSSNSQNNHTTDMKACADVDMYAHPHSGNASGPIISQLTTNAIQKPQMFDIEIEAGQFVEPKPKSTVAWTPLSTKEEVVERLGMKNKNSGAVVSCIRDQKLELLLCFEGMEKAQGILDQLESSITEIVLLISGDENISTLALQDMKPPPLVIEMSTQMTPRVEEPVAVPVSRSESMSRSDRWKTLLNRTMSIKSGQAGSFAPGNADPESPSASDGHELSTLGVDGDTRKKPGSTRPDSLKQQLRLLMNANSSDEERSQTPSKLGFVGSMGTPDRGTPMFHLDDSQKLASTSASGTPQTHSPLNRTQEQAHGKLPFHLEQAWNAGIHPSLVDPRFRFDEPLIPTTLNKICDYTIDQATADLPLNNAHVAKMNMLRKRIFQMYIDRVNAKNKDPKTLKTSMSQFVYELFIQKYGLKSLAEQHLKAFVQSARRYTANHPQIELFARFCGYGNELPLEALNFYVHVLSIFVQIMGSSVISLQRGYILIPLARVEQVLAASFDAIMTPDGIAKLHETIVQNAVSDVSGQRVDLEWLLAFLMEAWLEIPTYPLKYRSGTAKLIS